MKLTDVERAIAEDCIQERFAVTIDLLLRMVDIPPVETENWAHWNYHVGTHARELWSKLSLESRLICFWRACHDARMCRISQVDPVGNGETNVT